MQRRKPRPGKGVGFPSCFGHRDGEMVPEFFTPDGDGLNDFWVPRNQEAFPEILTIIFDRYGREIYRMG
ncbi:MAG: T9SS type B sorting domain-containing protein, partial [Cyanobacteria bacterium P01_A01_bin.68]